MLEVEADCLSIWGPALCCGSRFESEPGCHPLTRFCHSFDGNVLLIGHKAQHREDGKTCHEARAAVQTTKHDAVPEEQDRERRRSRSLSESPANAAPRPVSLTCSSCCRRRCSSPEQWGSPSRWHRRRRFGFLRPPTPENVFIADQC